MSLNFKIVGFDVKFTSLELLYFIWRLVNVIVTFIHLYWLKIVEIWFRSNLGNAQLFGTFSTLNILLLKIIVGLDVSAVKLLRNLFNTAGTNRFLVTFIKKREEGGSQNILQCFRENVLTEIEIIKRWPDPRLLCMTRKLPSFLNQLPNKPNQSNPPN